MSEDDIVAATDYESRVNVEEGLFRQAQRIPTLAALFAAAKSRARQEALEDLRPLAEQVQRDYGFGFNHSTLAGSKLAATILRALAQSPAPVAPVVERECRCDYDSPSYPPTDDEMRRCGAHQLVAPVVGHPFSPKPWDLTRCRVLIDADMHCDEPLSAHEPPGGGEIKKVFQCRCQCGAVPNDLCNCLCHEAPTR